MLKVLVACANGAGTSLMMKITVEKVLNELQVRSFDIHHCSLSEGKSVAINYGLICCPLNFVSMFQNAIDKGIKVVGIKNILSQSEIKEKILASGFIAE